ncbi:PP2C-like domain-containing protein [Clonorchis sinensis]|uniref:PP2C-like domain-containing protein n=1 Tax=Clonorchis sinensis TaxID=79923 RepID=A0A419QE90_CLOSI|nr:PP2C-like domain-containing protein [Clonorchis sinensis]
MSVTAKAPSGKPAGKSEFGLTKSWSFKEGIRALRRSFVSSPSQDSCGSTNCESPHSELGFRNRVFSQCDVWRALSPAELPEAAVFPLVSLRKLSNEVFAAATGPNTGFLATQKWAKVKPANPALVESWKPLRNRKAHGISVSLYEKNPLTDRVSGEPNADAFIVQARCDSAFLAVADGVNWGRDAMQAARCAILAVYEYLETHLYGSDSTKLTLNSTQDAAQLLFETFSAAQERIVGCTTGLTTLCVALVLPVVHAASPSKSSTASHERSLNRKPQQFAVMVVSVGDSQAFLLSKFHGIREITGWVPTTVNGANVDRLRSGPFGVDSWPASPDLSPTSPPPRDFRDAGGALGSVYTNGNPELHNLICAVTLCDPGDLVILGSDGLTDNFDPIITQIAVPESPRLDFVDDAAEFDDDSSTVDEVSTQCGYPATSWSKPLSLSPPPQISIWPRPPPPPPTASCPFSLPSLLDPCGVQKTLGPFERQPNDIISARNLNFTNQLELSCSERRRYAGKELERIWHETDAFTSGPSGVGGTTSARDLCEALITHALRLTSRKRELLQDPNLARLRMNPSRLKQLSISTPEDELGIGPVKAQRKWLADTLKSLPGKLDHATVVAYEVGIYRGNENEVYEEMSLEPCSPATNLSPTHSHSEV